MNIVRFLITLLLISNFANAQEIPSEPLVFTFSANNEIVTKREFFGGLQFIKNERNFSDQIISIPAPPLGFLPPIITCEVTLSGSVKLTEATQFAGDFGKFGVGVGAFVGRPPLASDGCVIFREITEQISPTSVPQDYEVSVSESYISSGNWGIFSPGEDVIEIPIRFNLSTRADSPTTYHTLYEESVRATLKVTVVYPTLDQPDLRLVNPQSIVQTAYDPRVNGEQIVTVIKDKSFALEVQGSSENVQNGSNVGVKVELLSQGSGALIESYIANFAIMGNAFRGFLSIDEPLPLGEYRIRVTIDPENDYSESNEDNNISFTRVFKVIESPRLDLMFTHLSCEETGPDCYGSSSLSDLGAFTTESNKTDLSDILPVTNERVTFESVAPGFLGDSNVSEFRRYAGFNYTLGFINDQIRLREKIVNTESKRKLFALVPERYFIHHGSSDDLDDKVDGYAFLEKRGRTGQVAFFRASGGRYTVPHELVHMLGTVDHFEGQVDGYNNRLKKEISSANNLMAKFPQSENLWISDFSYQWSLETLLKSPVDPEITVISGIMDLSTNSIVDQRIQEFPFGQLTPNSQFPDTEFRAVDEAGNTVSAIGVETAQLLLFHGDVPAELEIVEPDIVPFVVSFPKNDEVSSIEIEREGVLIANIPVIRTFSDIVDLIEPDDFKFKKPFVRKLKLRLFEKKAKFIDYLVENGKNKRAYRLSFYLKKLMEVSLSASENKGYLISEIDKLRASIK